MTNPLSASGSATPSALSPMLRFYRSPIGKKLITGITGLGLAVFVLVHMLGNLLLFVGPGAYNAYAHRLESWGIFLYLIEAVLLLAVLFHAGVGVEIFVRRLKARPEGYSRYQSVGRPSYQSVSSRTMIITGTLMAGFLVTHLLTFKFGPYYPTQLGNTTGRDLARLVVETFHQPFYTVGYTAILLMLGLHLRHGLWSGLQSLGALGAGVRPLAYGVSTVLAVAIALGFLVLPWAIYLDAVG
ncbi:MAG: succinate dehydrogenase cytochrome b subunit [Nodosilinea sp.]